MNVQDPKPASRCDLRPSPGRGMYRLGENSRALSGALVKMSGAMSTNYHQLLEAAIRHLEDLKSNGVRYVCASPTTLRALAAAPARRAQPSSLATDSRAARSENRMPQTQTTVAERVSSQPIIAAEQPDSAGPREEADTKEQAMAEL